MDDHPPPFRAERTFLTGRSGFRFGHLLEVFVNIDGTSRLITYPRPYHAPSAS